ncbi:MAG: hypothetical protein PHD76_04790 [Methylacidiphilales bacterium]|nr:hypothetical protein [Candidatus Methylacidiphilales bacterium]
MRELHPRSAAADALQNLAMTGGSGGLAFEEAAGEEEAAAAEEEQRDRTGFGNGNNGQLAGG